MRTCSHSQRPYQRLKGDHRGDRSLQGPPGTGIVLVAGHGGGSVIQYDGHDRAVVVHDVQERGNTGMEEGGVADHRDVMFRASAFDRAVSDRDAGTHAAYRVLRV